MTEGLKKQRKDKERKNKKVLQVRGKARAIIDKHTYTQSLSLTERKKEGDTYTERKKGRRQYAKRNPGKERQSDR